MGAVVVLTLVGGARLSVLGVIFLAAVGTILLGMLAGTEQGRKVASLSPLTRAALLAIILLPLIQLLPLPPTIWQALPGQELRHAVLEYAGLAGTWQPLSLTPIATAEAAVAGIAFVLLLVTLLVLEPQDLRQVVWLILFVVAIGMAIGLAQVASGGYPALHESRNRGALLGLFANKNHMALAVACTIPLLWLVLDVGGRRHPAGFWLFIGYLVLTLVVVVATNSRSGLLVWLVAACIAGGRLLPQESRRWKLILIPALLIGCAALSFSDRFNRLFDRFGTTQEDLRWAFWEQSLPLLQRYWTTGSGAGSYAQVFIANEKLAWVKPTYVNAAHNDYLQLPIEFGVLGVSAALLLAAAVLRAWLRGGGGEGRRRRTDAVWAGSIIVLLFCLQSLVDYPLRRVATLPLFAIGCALILSDGAVRRAGGPKRADEW